MDKELIDKISSLRSVRNFKPDPVEDDKLTVILRTAVCAPSSGNTQPWEFIVVKDLQMKARIKEVISSTWHKHVLNRSKDLDEQTRRIYDEVTLLASRSDKVPVMIFACLNLRKSSKSEEARYASIYPAVQNILLAAHCHGLGTCLTTHGCNQARGEEEIKKILGIPDYIKIAALIFMGYPAKKLHPPRRSDVSTVVHNNAW